MNPAPERDEATVLASRLAERAPLLLPTVALLLGIGAADSFRVHLGGPGYLLSASCAVAYLLMQRARVAPIFASAALFVCFASLGFARFSAVRVDSGVDWAARISADGMLAHLRAEVLTAPVSRPAEKRNPYYPIQVEQRVLFRARCIGWNDPTSDLGNAPILRISAAPGDSPVQIGDTLELRGWLYSIRGPRNPGEADWRRVSELDGVVAGVAVEDARLLRVVSRSPSIAEGVREAALARLSRALHGDGPDGDPDVGDRLLDAMILGQRSAIDRAWNEVFACAGAVHFLSVSGFHIGLLAFSAAWLASWVFRASHRGAAFAALLIVAGYLSFAEWNAPILRAAVLTVCFAGAAWLNRAHSPLHWLCAAALLLAAIEPREVLRPGFQLCFSQVAVLILIVPRIAALVYRPAQDTASLWLLMWRRGWRMVVDWCIIAAVLWVFAAPIVWLHFGQIQSWGALGSLLLTIPMTLLLWAAFALMAVRSLPLVEAWLGPPLQSALDVCVNLNLWIVRLFADLPGAAIRVAPPGGWWIVAAFGAAGVLVFAARFAPRVRRVAGAVALAGLIVVAVGIGIDIAARMPTGHSLTVWILDVGNGSAAVVQSAGAPPLIVDAGTLRNRDVAEQVRGATDARGATVVLSHADLDHYSGIPGLLGDDGGAVLVSGEFLRRESVVDGQLATFAAALPRGLATRIVVAGDSWTVGDASVEVLWPPAGEVELPDNDRSLVLRVTQHGRSVLFPGDIEEFALRALADRHSRGEIDLQADVLIAPHHGAVVPGATESFLAAVAPEHVVASTARSTEALAALVEKLFVGRCDLVVTERSGAVWIEIDREGTISLRTPYVFHNTQ
ncbi:MAG: ComEC/Rec2 family competence protein [Phycisphaerae bacterium]|nr:ComEC/Rec2 family competence protein [Phycisphaerae bacterium]